MEKKTDIPVVRVTGDRAEGIIDEVASELPVTLFVNDKPLVTLLCTPAELEELAVGFLLSEGILRGPASLKKVDVIEKDLAVRVQLADLPAPPETLFQKRTISSGCGSGITFTGFRASDETRIFSEGPVLSAHDVRALLKQFRSLSSLYLETGGVHSAALSDGKEVLFFSEDIGRHNAVDKLLGKAFLRGVSVQDRVLLTSGRVTSEIMTKAGRNRIPVIISRAAPSCMAVSYAEDLGITLVGFARGEKMNIYSWPKRIRI